MTPLKCISNIISFVSYNILIKFFQLQSKTKKYGTRWPTFPEFVNYLLAEFRSGHDLDMHWTPITNFCTPCQVRFDVIAKFETLEEDQKYLIEKTSLGHLIKPQWKNSGKGKNTQELLMKYYAQLTKYQITSLHELFRYDFELFNYSPAEFVKMGLDKDPDDLEPIEPKDQHPPNSGQVFSVNSNNNENSNKLIKIFAIE